MRDHTATRGGNNCKRVPIAMRVDTDHVVQLICMRVNEAFQRVLDDPAAGDALQHPALKPLLDEAAD